MLEQNTIPGFVKIIMRQMWAFRKSNIAKL